MTSVRWLIIWKLHEETKPGYHAGNELANSVAELANMYEQALNLCEADLCEPAPVRKCVLDKSAHLSFRGVDASMLSPAKYMAIASDVVANCTPDQETCAWQMSGDSSHTYAGTCINLASGVRDQA